MNTPFWAGKRVLVTGHTGFKGSWLCLWLQLLGAKVFGFALKPPTEPNLFEAAEVSKGMTSRIGDIRDFDGVQAAFREYRPEIVLHLAAQPLVRYSYRAPVETYATNVLGTVHVLEAIRQSSEVRAVVSVTTDKCYENREWAWGYREDDRLGGHDPYSNSKACAELVTAAYRSSFFGKNAAPLSRVGLATARAGNVIGGGDWAEDRLIPDSIRAITAGQTVVVRHPGAIRPWQHVLEPLSGYLTLAERLWDHGSEYARAWNFGPADGDARPVSWVVTELTRLWGAGAQWEQQAVAGVHEANYLKLDSSLARSRLGWRSRLSLGEAIEWTVEWYRACGRRESLRPLTEAQISRYQGFFSKPGE